MKKEPSYSERIRQVARLRRTAAEELGLPDNHLIHRHLRRLEKHWQPAILKQVNLCVERLRAEKEKLDRVGDRIPPHDAFHDGNLAVGEAMTPHGTPTPVAVDANQCPTHWLVPGTPGSGKTIFVRLLLAGLIVATPWVWVLVFDPNRSYEALCRDPETWVSMAALDTRIGFFRAPLGYPYELLKSQKVDALGRGELLHSRYLIQKRLDRLFLECGVPDRDNGACWPPYLSYLRDDLAARKEKPGSPDERYRAAALNVIDGRIRTTGRVYDCARGMEDQLTSTRVRIDTHGMSPPESVEFFETSLIHYLYCRRSLEPLVEPPVLQALVVVEEAQVLLGKHGHANIAFYQEILLKSRSLGIAFMFVVQDLDDIDPRVLSAISNWAVFRQSTAKNKRLARDILDLSPREAELLGRLPTGECFMKMTGHSRWPFPFVARVVK